MDEKLNGQDDIYEITFRNGALKKLRELAKRLDVEEDNLAEVLSKGMKVIELAEDNKVTVKNSGDTYIVDLKKI